MSGHSKWASIKHKKPLIDTPRSKIFTKFIKEITVAARLGGKDPDANARLRTAILAAKGANMPQDNIQRAVKKGCGELPGVSYEEASYEGYGPGGIAVLVNIVTDKKNRTLSEIRYIFSKNNGSLGEAGCVAWMFEKKGQILLEEGNVDEDELLMIALDSGAEDVKKDGSAYEIITTIKEFEAVKKALEDNNIELSVAEISMLPQTTIKLEGKQAQQMLKLMEALEDHDDVQNVYANFDIPEEVMAGMNN
jgi:YebC/PmpR family DNA-binding regulatory protein